MSKFKPAHRTVVTEISSFVVDQVSRVGVVRQSAATKVGDQSLNTLDVNVNEGTPFVLDNINKVLFVSASEPFRVNMLQTGDPQSDGEEGPVVKRVEVLSPTELKAGERFVLEIVDENVPLATNKVEAALFNQMTGETEILTLTRIANYRYAGYVETSQGSMSTNFDDDMAVSIGDVLEVHYNYHSGTKRTYTDVISRYAYATLKLNPVQFPGRNLNVMVHDLSNAGKPMGVDVLNSRTGVVEFALLTEVRPGLFVASVPVRLETDPEVGSVSVTAATGDSIEVRWPGEEDTVETTQVALTSGSYRAAVLRHNASPVADTEMSFTVFDPGHSSKPSVPVAVSNRRTAEYETVVAASVSPLGVFQGSILIGPSAGLLNNDGSLRAVVGDSIRATHVDSVTPGVNIREMNAVVLSPVVEEDVPEVTAPSPGGSAEMICNGMFFFNGNFVGKVTITGMGPDLTRCRILHV